MLVAGGLISCTDPNRQPLAGSYFTTFTEDGDPIFCIDDPQLGSTTLSSVSATGITKGYVAILADSCYLYPVDAITAIGAHRARIGPFTEAGCQQRIMELTGDSLRLKRIDI
jgi:hypothetical protein